MKIAIIGASGFVGTAMQSFFASKGFEVLALDRRDTQKSVEDFSKSLEGSHAIINLAGAPIIQRWTETYKKTLYDSRILTTRKLVDAMRLMTEKPSLFLSTSAVGIYGGGSRMSEENFIYGDDFLASICKDWEAEAHKAEDFTRTVIFRFGVVLGKNGGALSKMLTPFRLGLGGVIGDGSEPFSWVHLDDLLEGFLFAIHDDGMHGAYNMTAPNPVTNRVFTKTLGKVLHRPTILPLPKFVLGLLFSEGASVLTQGQEVVPERLLKEGFVFKYPHIEEALRSIV